jgi:hypothetical protein
MEKKLHPLSNDAWSLLKALDDRISRDRFHTMVSLVRVRKYGLVSEEDAISLSVAMAVHNLFIAAVDELRSREIQIPVGYQLSLAIAKSYRERYEKALSSDEPDNLSEDLSALKKRLEEEGLAKEGGAFMLDVGADLQVSADADPHTIRRIIELGYETHAACIDQLVAYTSLLRHFEEHSEECSGETVIWFRHAHIHEDDDVQTLGQWLQSKDGVGWKST